MVNALPRVDRLIGRTIDNGRLCLIQPLGQGSGGVVFRAGDTTSSILAPRDYAVKCMFKAEKGTRQYQFQRREIQYHSSVSSHRNVITLHRVVEEGDYLFLVLDYCPGGDMFKFLRERPVFRRNDDLVKKVFVQLVDAVEACHDRGVFHRDIKPENIMCNADGTSVSLGDFGLATEHRWSKNFGAGTASFMSPECIGGGTGEGTYCTRSNDIWALGVILTSMISGHNPWHRAAMTDDCFRAFVHDPTFIRNMLPISSAADGILRRIFVRPSRRISLSKLRQLVLDADTFFMTDDEIALSTPYVQLAAASYLGSQLALPQDSTASLGVLLNTSDHKWGPEVVEIKEAGSEPAPVTVQLQGSFKGPTTRSQPAFIVLETHFEEEGHYPFVSPSPSPPPPQPVLPSFSDFIVPLSSPSKQSTSSKKLWRPQSPIRLFRRIMDKILVD